MFGIAVARLDALDAGEKERYQAVYCGLCRALRDRYGQVARAALTYDMTFYALLCASLHEPREETGEARCVAHPTKRMPYARTDASDRAADLSVALAYHKCLDDAIDDGGARAHIARAALAGAYRKAQGRMPEACRAVDESMRRIRTLEAAPDTPPDACASEFGSLLGFLFAQGQGAWAQAMGALGFALGRFIYMMDAAVDLADDAKRGSYNPLLHLERSANGAEAGEDMPGAAFLRRLLEALAADAAEAFEKLPLEQDVHLLRSVLYAGVWQKFNQEYRSAEGDGGTEAGAEGMAHGDGAYAQTEGSA